MSSEDIFEETQLYQDVEQKGRMKELRNMLLYLTTLRFPGLRNQAYEQAEQAKSQEKLRVMIGELSIATTDQEARKVLGG